MQFNCMFLSLNMLFLFKGDNEKFMKHINEDLKIVFNSDNRKTILKSHYHNSYEIVFITEGKSKFNINGKTYIAKKNDMVFINKFESHSNEIMEYPYKRFYMLVPQSFIHKNFDDKYLVSILKNRPSEFNHVISLNNHFQQIYNITENILQEYNKKNPFYKDVIGSLFKNLLILVYRMDKSIFSNRTYSSNNNLIFEIQEYLENNYKDNITLENTALSFHINQYYLSHLFKKITGFTFKEYLINLRLSHAKNLLVQSEKSVGDICYESGFNNINHFIRIFKIKNDITPLQFRKKLK